MFRILARRRVLYTTAAGAAAAGGAYYYVTSPQPSPFPPPSGRPPAPWTPATRSEMIRALKKSSLIGKKGDGKVEGPVKGEEYDLLIVGGGATGAGVAVDAASRGLKVALVERDDFSSGTSSKSTKLVHGGVRYLQKAIFELDYEQWKLVREALHERRIFLQTAPYLSHMLPIMLPVYKYWQLPYYYAGCKLYDILAGPENMESSYIIGKGKALDIFPMLKADGLVGAVVYYDGQHNDARMNISLIMTAVQLGAVVANHVEVTALHKNKDEKLCGARVKDNMTGEEWDVQAKGIVNATGPFTDALLRLDALSTSSSSITPSLPIPKPTVAPSSGVHITLPNYYSPRTMGLLDPATSDGRVIFFLPWQGNTIAGTTDTQCDVERDPLPKEEEIRWILEEVRRYLSPDIKVRRGDVLSAWSGLRPLIRDPNSSNSKDLVRSHIVTVSPSGLLTIAGGKWTTYRRMAEEAVDEAFKVFPGLKREGVSETCRTERVRLVGSEEWSKTMFIRLIQRFGVETEVAKHLSDTYGDRAWTVCALAEATGLTWPLHGKRLTASYPYIEAEVRYAARHEYAQTATDFLARRSRLSFLNAQAALDALPRVIEIMSEELGWTRRRQKEEWYSTRKWLMSMGLPALGELEGDKDAGGFSYTAKLNNAGEWIKRGVGLGNGEKEKKKEPSIKSRLLSRAVFSAEELDLLRKAFNEKIGEGRAELKKEELKMLVRDLGYDEMSDRALDDASYGRKLLRYEDFLDVCAELKESSMRRVPEPAPGEETFQRKVIPVEKSGGGV